MIAKYFSRLLRRRNDGPEALDPACFVFVMLPGDIQPLARGERFEDPLQEVLQGAGVAHVSGGGSQLDSPHADGSARVAFAGIDIDVSDRAQALRLLRQHLVRLGAPEGAELHYTVGRTRCLDRLQNGEWSTGLARTFEHPAFGV